MNTENYATKDLDHLGIVAGVGVCREIGLVKSIDGLLSKPLVNDNAVKITFEYPKARAKDVMLMQ